MRRNIIAILLVGMAVCSVKSQTLTPATIQTPNGSYVTDSYYISGVAEYNTYYLPSLTQYISSTYNGAEVIDVPSEKYNCHAYAWHLTEGGDTVWIGYHYSTAEDIYWQDGSYIEVAENNATKVSYHETGNHSAIRLNSTWYQSKWGACALVKHHPNDVPAIYHPELQKKFYIRTPSIIGTDSLCGTEIYSISHLPSNATVYWSFLSNKPYLNSLIQQNYPLAGQCSINIENNENIDDILIANIYINNTHIITLQKAIKTNWSLSGTYSVTGNSILYNNIIDAPFSNNKTIWVFPGYNTTLHSEQFANVTLSHTYSSLMTWNYDGNETVSMHISPYAPDNHTMTVTGTGSADCDNFKFNIKVLVRIIDPILNTKHSNTLNIILNEDNLDYIVSSGLNWHVEIRNATTGKTVYKGNLTDVSTVINTSDWTPGLYTISHMAGEHAITQKVIIK